MCGRACREHSHEIFKHLASRGIKPAIKVRRDAPILGNKARDEVVREIRKGMEGGGT